MIKCRVIRPYGTYRKGDIVTPPSAMWREQLMAQGLVEIVRDEEETLEHAMAQPVCEKAVRKRVRKKRVG